MLSQEIVRSKSPLRFAADVRTQSARLTGGSRFNPLWNHAKSYP